VNNKVSYSNYENQFEGFITSVRNLGDGQFWAPRSYRVIAGIDSLAVGEFNGDGRKDFAFGTIVSLSTPDGCKRVPPDGLPETSGGPFRPAWPPPT
jgi:hypothetical protein